MNEIALGIVCTLGGMLAIQVVVTLSFAATLWNWRRKTLCDQECPRVAAVLCLRGTDPFLPHCIEALLAQDYPRYDVRIVVDDIDDPAWPVVAEVVERVGADHVSVEALTQRRDSCSLKCSSVVQAIRGLDESYEVVALLDADTVPHRTWLRELVAPLADERVGAATGNRWYMPNQVSWGALVRYVWNAAAVAQMFLYRIAWGGTLAVKTKVFRESDLLERWGNAFCEDTMTYAALKKLGLKVAFVPSLMMVNREACDIGGFFRWVRRQLLTARLYHPGWLMVAVHGITTSVAPPLTVAFAIYALAVGNWGAAAWAGGALAIYELGLLLLLPALELPMRRIVSGRGEPAHWLPFWRLPQYVLALPLTQMVYAIVLLSSLTVRKVDWRGVSYVIDGPFRIRMVEYRPYQAAPPVEEAHSL